MILRRAIPVYHVLDIETLLTMPWGSSETDSIFDESSSGTLEHERVAGFGLFRTRSLIFYNQSELFQLSLNFWVLVAEPSNPISSPVGDVHCDENGCPG